MFSWLLLVVAIAPTSPAAAGTDTSSPDPACFQSFGGGYRYWQDGWIVLHIEGAPYERGVQHGRLLAPEIAAYLRCYSLLLERSPGAGGSPAR
jgi:hypothetical protein